MAMDSDIDSRESEDSDAAGVDCVGALRVRVQMAMAMAAQSRMDPFRYCWDR